MSTPERIANLFEDLYNGKPWLDVSIIPVVKDLTAEQAAKKALPEANTIWEIVNHMISWRENVLQRLNGGFPETPANNYIEEITDPSAREWNHTLEKLEHSQQKWVSFLNNLKEEELIKTYPSNGRSFYYFIHGVLQHDAYHLGQLVILSKYV